MSNTTVNKKWHGCKIAGIIMVSILLSTGVFCSQRAFKSPTVKSMLRTPMVFDPESEVQASMIKNAKKLTWSMLRHELGVDKIGNWLDILADDKTPKSELLKNEVNEIKRKWMEWIKTKEQMVLENTAFDIKSLFKESDIKEIKDMKKLTLKVAEKFKRKLNTKKIAEKERTAKAIYKTVIEIRKYAKIAEHFITSISKLDIDVRDINKLVSFYDKKLLSTTRKESAVIRFDQCKGALYYSVVTGSYDFDGLVIIGMIDNLVENALRLGDSNVNITIKTELADDKMIKIEISNTAPGMTKEILSQIGSEGFTTKEQKQGGIGIYLTLKYIVDMQKGRMRVDTYTEEEGGLSREFSNNIGEDKISESQKNTIGTTWTLWIPLAETKPAIIPSRAIDI